MPKITLDRVGSSIAFAAGAAGIATIAFLTSGPLATDDVWWHLALGDLYREAGSPFLEAETRLHTAAGPPHPNAWLFDWMVSAIADHVGLQTLRAIHALFVTGLLLSVWKWITRLTQSTITASITLLAFIALSEYRLLQLRPELATIALTIATVAILLTPSTGKATRFAFAAIAGALWPNLHPGFPIGPALLGLGAATHFLVERLSLSTRASEDPMGRDGHRRADGREIALTAILMFIASGLNPTGYGAWALYLAAGVDAVSNAVVVDEWRAFSPFSAPGWYLPPSPVAWTVWWCLATLLPISILRQLKRRAIAAAFPLELLPLACVGLVAPLAGVRFLWLGILPLLYLAVSSGESLEAPRHFARRLQIMGCLALALALAATSALPNRLSPRGRAQYSQPYDASRYYGHAVAWLAEAEVEGRLFQPYFIGGFVEYALGPRLPAFVDGSLNFPAKVLSDYTAIIRDEPDTANAADLTEILDRYSVDFFVGVGLPTAPPPGRPWRYSTTALENDDRWVQVYRGLRSAVYLRRNARGAENLERIAAYYQRTHVPFDRSSGFSAADVLENAPHWAIEHGVAPVDHIQLVRTAESPRGRRARGRLAWTLGLLGHYEEALRIDSEEPDSIADPRGERARRKLWLALKLDRLDEAARILDQLEERATNPDAIFPFAEALVQIRRESDPKERARLARRFLPLDRIEAGRLRSVERLVIPASN